MFFDIYYLLFALPGLILAGIASWITHSTFNKYSRVAASSGLTGAQAAAQLLEKAGVRDVRIEPTDGFLSDHYNPADKTLHLSKGVYASNSLSAIGVACHEAGHAIQHAHAYMWLGLRSALVPATQFGSSLSYILFVAGALLNFKPLLIVGIALFALVVVFSIVTLPVEWDASSRAKHLMVSAGIVSYREQADAAKVLNAAFLTYVAAAVTALMQLLYYLWRAGLLGGRRDD